MARDMLLPKKSRSGKLPRCLEVNLFICAQPWVDLTISHLYQLLCPYVSKFLLVLYWFLLRLTSSSSLLSNILKASSSSLSPSHLGLRLKEGGKDSEYNNRENRRAFCNVLVTVRSRRSGVGNHPEERQKGKIKGEMVGAEGLSGGSV